MKGQMARTDKGASPDKTSMAKVAKIATVGSHGSGKGNVPKMPRATINKHR